MRIETLPNKSVVVIGTLINEADTVKGFRQFAIGERVKYAGMERTIYAVDTIVDGYEIYNFYQLSSRTIVNHVWIDEHKLLSDNPRPCPANIFDAISDCLPKVLPFINDNRIFITGE